MAHSIAAESLTPADELRVRLAESEKQVVNLAHTGARALDLLLNLDRLAELWPHLQAQGVDLRPELGRWETLQAAVRRNAPALLGELRAVGGLPAARVAHHPGGDASWWWYLSEETRSKAQRHWLRTGLILAGVALLGVALVLALRTFFPVDPAIAMAQARQTAGETKIKEQGDFAGALADFASAAINRPGEVDNWIRLGCVQQKLGDGDAEGSFAKARALLGSDVELRLLRATVFTDLGMLDEAQVDLDAVLAVEPDNPLAYYYLATLFEARQQDQEAMNALIRSSELAEQAKISELSVMARYRLGILMQRAPINAMLAVTPTPVAP